MRLGLLKVDWTIGVALLQIAAALFWIDREGPLTASAVLGWVLFILASLRINLLQDLRTLEKGEVLR